MEYFKTEKDMRKTRDNGLFLSDNQVEVLEKFNINYLSYASLDNLIFDIESILNEEEIEELEKLSLELSEMNYYNYTNK